MRKLAKLKLILILLLFTSCGARYKYYKFEKQATLDSYNPYLTAAWNTVPTGRTISFSPELFNFNLYKDDPAYNKLGFSPYRNNAAIYRDYYLMRSSKWQTLWGILN